MRKIVEEAIFRMMGYQVEEELGSGSGGAVYRCHRDCFGIRHESAIKATIMKYISTDTDGDNDEAWVETQERRRSFLEGDLRRRLSEVEALQSLRGKPGIIGIEDYEAGETMEGDRILLVRMELGKEIDFSDLCTGKIERRLEFLSCILEGLANCHEKGILHGDIKPANILKVDGAYKLIDFNISSVSCDSEMEERATWGVQPLMGTPDFAPPELLQKGIKGYFTDVYAVGMLAYMLFNDGVAPGQKVRLRGDEPEVPRFAGKELGETILKALHKDPGKRYADGRTFLNEWGNRSRPRESFEQKLGGRSDRCKSKESIRKSLSGSQKELKNLNWGNVWNGGFMCGAGGRCWISNQATGGLYLREQGGEWGKVAEGAYFSLTSWEDGLFCLDGQGRVRFFGQGDILEGEAYKFLLSEDGALVGKSDKGGGVGFDVIEGFFLSLIHISEPTRPY